MLNSNRALRSKSLGVCLVFPLVTGCSVSLTDQTFQPLLADSPVNEQTFLAEIEPGRGNTITGVIVAIDGQVEVMTPYQGNRWIGGVVVPRCLGVASYSFEVTYADSSGPATRRFPASGTFNRRIDGLPLDCEGGLAGAFETNSNTDLPDSNPGDGICSAGPGLDLDGNPVERRCTLRAAIMEANATPGINSINVRPATYELYDGSSISEESHQAIDSTGDLDITDDLLIGTSNLNRPGECVSDVTEVLDPTQRKYYDFVPGTPRIARIDGVGQGRVFDIHDRADGSDVRVEMDCLLVTGGLVLDEGSGRPEGGGIQNRGDLRLKHVIIARNHSGGETSGAGINNLGFMRITESAFLNNGSGEGGALVGGLSGGAIATRAGHTSIVRSAFINNHAARGGAIFTLGGSVNVTNTTFYENGDRGPAHWPVEFRGNGNGLHVAIQASPTGPVRITNSSFSNGVFRLFRATGAGAIKVDRSILYTFVVPDQNRPERVLCHNPNSIDSLGSNYLIANGENCFIDQRVTDIVGDRNADPYGSFSHEGFAPTLELSRIEFLLERAADGRDVPQLGIYDHGARAYRSGTSITLPCARVDQRGFQRSVSAAPGRRATCDIGAYEFGASR